MAVLPGGKVPYVLCSKASMERGKGSLEAPSTSRRFTLVGDTYVHGIMDGEGYDEEKLGMITLV